MITPNRAQNEVAGSDAKNAKNKLVSMVYFLNGLILKAYAIIIWINTVNVIRIIPIRYIKDQKPISDPPSFRTIL